MMFFQNSIHIVSLRLLSARCIPDVWKNGKDVVIKIRRPNIDQKIKLDLYLMRYLAKKLALEYPEMAAINIVGVVDEFGESIFKEIELL